jgi:hypothetical protein
MAELSLCCTVGKEKVNPSLYLKMSIHPNMETTIIKEGYAVLVVVGIVSKSTPPPPESQ